MFAELYLAPGGLLAWLLVGLIAGWLAGLATKGSGYGILGDVIVGIIGALVGGFLFGALVSGAVGFLGSILVAFLGACLCIIVVRTFASSGSTL
jgi:uncharacterized membrane protein YeaQ/YmgE (transglycosylase-associated protein family)